MIAVGCLALLIVSAGLSPSDAGHGTHTRLGLPACGWAVAFDAPCPTCGMTTAFAHAATADGWASLSAQPAGAAMAVLTAAGLFGGLHGALGGARVEGVFAWMVTKPALVTASAVVLVAWAWKWVTWAGL
ncbi:MAG: DUF2752 domain-containing protein [Planctomycetota bacterium]